MDVSFHDHWGDFFAYGFLNFHDWSIFFKILKKRFDGKAGIVGLSSLG